MTALDKYVRLESGGLWRADADAQRRDVGISFGDATLVIADTAGRPVAHWSLPAITRLNPGTRPAVFAPDDDAGEQIEIADDLMIDAIEEVRKALARARPKPGKLRHWITGGLVLATIALAVFWLPGALTRQTLAVVPAPKRTEIGAVVLGHMQAQSGPVCREPTGVAASEKLAARVLGPDNQTRIVIMPGVAQGAVPLPGGIIALDQALVSQTDDPAVAAGYVLAAHVARSDADPLEQILREAGLSTTFRLLTTGEIPGEVLQAHAVALLHGTLERPTQDKLRAAFAAAQLPSTPYDAMAEARGNGATQVGEDPMAGQEVPLILSDGDWVGLQNICNI